MNSMTRLGLATLATLAVALVAACGGSDEAGGPSAVSPTPDATVTATPVATEPGDPPADGGIVSVPPTPLPAPPPDRKLVRAPIDGAEILILESFPVQYRLSFISGLPSGCARFHGVEVERSGTTVTVTVWNTQPEGAVICTAEYGMHTDSVSLGIGTDYTPGVKYTVLVNDRTLTFLAQ